MTCAKAGSTVAVLGASTKEERYSNKAVKMLLEHKHCPIPVHPSGIEVHGLKTKKSLGEISESVDTLTMYIGPKLSSGAYDSIIALKPRRVIFNPGSENDELAAKLETAGIEVVIACTLVMLTTGLY
jgi:hypothetical protein